MTRLALLLTLAMAFPAAAADETPLGYRVKAAYLYNFVKFVEWPADARSGPLNICIAGRNPFGTALAEIIHDEVVNGRPLRSRVILEPESGCHVLFVPEGAVPAYLRSARGMPTLTVGETDDFLQQGGIIAFVTQGKNIRFEINTEAAEQARLQVSSRLLQLALNTRETR